MNILEEVQQYVADKLNADTQLSACPFLVENRRDIDFQIKQALGKQGVVGVVMTPKATYAGAYMNVGIAWQLDELEIDVVENVAVNRGKKNGYITGQDAAMRLFDVLCPLSGEHEGQFSPVSYEEGEDNSLLVNKSVLKCLVHKLPPLEMRTKVTYADGSSLMVEVEGVLSSSSIPSINDVVEVEIGNAVTSIGEYAFDRCAYLETVVIPKSVETIGTQGFSRTVRLTSVTIEGNGLKIIGDGAFAAATALTSISLPDSVVSIGRSAFEDCVSLTSIVIPASVQTMDREVFLGCSELMNVTFSSKTKATVKGMDNYNWALPARCVIHCTDGDIVVGSTLVVYQDGQQQEIPIFGELTRNSIPNANTIASVNIGEAVTSIGMRAFFYRSSLSSVTIPDSVTNIGDEVFCGCSALTSVTIPDSVTNIGAGAFVLCNSLTSIMIPESVTSMGNDVFKQCSGLTTVEFKGRTLAQVKAIPDASGNLEYSWGLDESVIMPEIVEDEALYITAAIPHTWLESTPEFDASTGTFSGFAEKANAVKVIIPSKVNGVDVTRIGDSAFRDCSALTSVTIPDSVTNIRNYTFQNCTGLTSVTIPDSVTSIGYSTFSGCTSLTSMTIPGSVTLISPGAFVNCTGLTSVVVGNGVKDIANYAFQNCTNLASVTIPASVMSIGDDAFKNCTNVTDVVVPGWSCHIPFDAVTNLVVSEGTTSIWPSGFSDSSSLMRATIPESVTSIGTRAFRNCSSLTSLTIPNSVTSIGQYAFSGSGIMIVAFSGKSKETVQGMENYSWSLRSGCVIHCTDGDITI